MKILIADDHWMVREALKQVVHNLHQRLEVFEAATFDEAARILSLHPDIDLMMVDLVMPGFEEFAGLRRLRTDFPNTPVVVVSVHEDQDYVMRALAYGVVGYIPKSDGGPEVERALERVLAGEVSLPRRLIQRAPATEVPPAAPPPPLPAPTAPPAQEAVPRPLDALTEREHDVLMLLGQGYSIKRIAGHFDLSTQTVRVHLGNAMKKLNLPDRAAATHYAVSVFGGLTPAGRG